MSSSRISVSRHRHWVLSERVFFLGLMSRFIDANRRPEEPTAFHFMPVMEAMTREAVRHHLSGCLYLQDPWPIRTYTLSSVRNIWHSLKRQARERADAEAGAAGPAANQPRQNFEEPILDEQEREFEQLLAPARRWLAAHEPIDRQPIVEDQMGDVENYDLQDGSADGAIDPRLLLEQATKVEGARAVDDRSHFNQWRALAEAQAQEALAQLLTIFQQRDAGPSPLERSRNLLARIAADKETEEEFWRQFNG
ncbi:hypothetical protein NHQ30_007007 [Ciborinia camelliae]|nr:hypothetical protein NHQ30_007007 [Ciborinia camelliae]